MYFTHSFYLAISKPRFGKYLQQRPLNVPSFNLTIENQTGFPRISYLEKHHLLGMPHLNKEDHNTGQNMAARVAKLMQWKSTSDSTLYNFPFFCSSIQFCWILSIQLAPYNDLKKHVSFNYIWRSELQKGCLYRESVLWCWYLLLFIHIIYKWPGKLQTRDVCLQVTFH